MSPDIPTPDIPTAPPTLLDYAAERLVDPFWADVHRIISEVNARAAALPPVNEENISSVPPSRHRCEGCGLPAGYRGYYAFTGQWGSVPRFADEYEQFSVPIEGRFVMRTQRINGYDVVVGVNKFARVGTKQLYFCSIQCAENVLFTTAYSHEFCDRCNWCGSQFEDRTFGTRTVSRPLRRYCSKECQERAATLPLGNGIRLHNYLLVRGLPGLDGITREEAVDAAQPREQRRCRLGKRCMRYTREFGAGIVPGRGKYCSSGCIGRASRFKAAKNAG